MESDLRTPAARLRAGLANLSAAPPSLGARPLPRAAAGKPRPLGALLGGPSGDIRSAPAVAESESVPPRPGPPGGGGRAPPPLRAAPQARAARLLAGAV